MSSNVPKPPTAVVPVTDNFVNTFTFPAAYGTVGAGSDWVAKLKDDRNATAVLATATCTTDAAYVVTATFAQAALAAALAAAGTPEKLAVWSLYQVSTKATIIEQDVVLRPGISS